MSRESLIRRISEIAFVLLFGGGLALGGGAALAGIPRLLDAVTPDMAAQAGAKPGGGAFVQSRTRFAIAGGFAESRFKPQVLYPVTVAPKPDWLAEAIRAAR